MTKQVNPLTYFFDMNAENVAHCQYHSYVGEGRVRWGGWVSRGGSLVEKTTKAAMLIF